MSAVPLFNLYRSRVRQVKFLMLTYRSSLFPELPPSIIVTGSICLFLLQHLIPSNYPFSCDLDLLPSTVLYRGPPGAQTTAGKMGQILSKDLTYILDVGSRDFFSVHSALSFEFGHEANEASRLPTILRTPIT